MVLENSPAILPREGGRGLDAVRSSIADGCLIGLCVAVLPALAASFSRLADIGWIDVMGLHILLTATIFGVTLMRRRLPVRLRAGFLIAVFYLIGLGNLVHFGAVGDGTFFLGACLMAFLLAGTATGIFVIAACLASLAFVYGALQTDLLALGIDLNAYTLLPSAWLTRAFGFVFLVSAISASIVVFNRDLVAGLRRSERERRQLRDMTAQLQAARDEALAGSRAKSDFLANASHELRTPLNAILGFSEYLTLKQGEIAPERSAEYIRDIHQSGRFLLEMVNDLLDLARIEADAAELSEEECDLAALLRDTIRTVAPIAATAQVSVTASGLEAPFMVYGDRRMLTEIAFNLLGNAIKFNRETGTVAVALRHPPGGDIEIEFADSGIGVDPAAIPELFKPFGRADSGTARQSGGTGLGLSIVRGLAGLHGGAVSMESVPGEGTIVRVRLPAERRIVEPASLFRRIA